MDGAPFIEDAWQREGGGGGRSRCCAKAGCSSRRGVNFSHVHGDAMRCLSATAHRPELAGRSFEAMGRLAGGSSAEPPTCPPAMPTCGSLLPKSLAPDPVWWFGGGFDLTPLLRL
ncbi:coproporphyrinogen III oxidase [Klebsiella pneumoniae subsp. pneumoniae]|nr:coproporphyrinogen III oxidase [Klebsiella pneumoniae subsp. pneumoniae]